MNLRRRNKPTRDVASAQHAPATVDGGWAWMVCFGGHLCVMLSPGYLTSLGVLYIEWKEYFALSAAGSSWIVSIPFLVASPLCFISGMIATRFGVRRVAMIGSVINGLATVLGSYSRNVQQLYLCGVMSGIGTTMVVTPAFIILSQYFNDKFALANGIVNVGANVGQMIFSALFRHLVDQYGWRGAMFIFGAIQLNGVAASALFRPLKAKLPVVYENVLEMETLDDADTKQAKDGKETQLQILKRNLMVFRNVPVIMMLVVTSLYACGLMVNLVHIPARAMEGGVTNVQSASLLTMFAVVSLITRATHGWFVDRNYINSFTLQQIVILGSAVATFLNPISDSYAFLVGNSIVVGAFTGIGSPLLIYNVRTLASPAQLPSALSLISAVFFLFAGTGTLIAGEIYDATGNYIAPFLVGGGMYLTAFCIVSLLMFIRRRGRSEVVERQI
ncbi:monocarboxylate transporter 13-like [Asterias rubens]|uniref:monocarboxylate transporter 13-like n=1 Tax=Asterias rubens TaxID=7604 RepID=UPI001454F172|nr:monocarboxylate transporter 13-like [Asterias rubens]